MNNEPLVARMGLSAKPKPPTLDVGYSVHNLPDPPEHTGCRLKLGLCLIYYWQKWLC